MRAYPGHWAAPHGRSVRGTEGGRRPGVSGKVARPSPRRGRGRSCTARRGSARVGGTVRMDVSVLRGLAVRACRVVQERDRGPPAPTPPGRIGSGRRRPRGRVAPAQPGRVAVAHPRRGPRLLRFSTGARENAGERDCLGTTAQGRYLGVDTAGAISGGRKCWRDCCGAPVARWPGETGSAQSVRLA